MREIKAKLIPLPVSLREYIRRMELVAGILMVTTLTLVGVVVWLVWTTIRIRGTVRRERSGEPDKSITRFDAELFVETYRSRKRGKNGIRHDTLR
jgi:hypothetical protein